MASAPIRDHADDHLVASVVRAKRARQKPAGRARKGGAATADQTAREVSYLFASKFEKGN